MAWRWILSSVIRHIPEFKAKARERYKIEAKNAELKHVYGYDRAESYGLYSMQMQGAITIFAANIKRILKLG